MSEMSKISVKFSTQPWELKTPFRITGHVFEQVEILYVEIEQQGMIGRGEAAGVYYLNEDGASMLAQAESIKSALVSGANRQSLRELLPLGGARNAIDCALWDLEAKLTTKSIWALTDIQPQPTHSFLTVAIDTTEAMAKNAAALQSNRIKVKLDHEKPLERMRAIREARPDALLIVDVNQGWNFAQLVDIAPKFAELNVSMIEQPLPRGGDEELEDYTPPLPIAADESCLDTNEFEQAARRYQMINIKLDKTGGLTEALDLAALAKAQNIELMVGNMVGTSLGMAPGFVVAQLCRFTDLDGVLFLKNDRKNPIHYDNGLMTPPESALWG